MRRWLRGGIEDFMKNVKRIITWIVLNGIICGLVYAVVFTPMSANVGLVQITKFMLWTNSIACWLLLPLIFLGAYFAKPDDKRKQKEKVKRSVPWWLSHLVDMAVVLSCAYAGWVWTAAFYFSHIFALGMMFACFEIIYERQNPSSDSSPQPKI